MDSLPCRWENDVIIVFDDLRIASPYRVEDVFKQALFKRYNFIVRAQKTNYQDEQRVKHTINKAFTIDYADESSSLIQEINRYLEG